MGQSRLHQNLLMKHVSCMVRRIKFDHDNEEVLGLNKVVGKTGK